MKTALTVVLAVLVISLAAYIVWQILPEGHGKRQSPTAEPRITPALPATAREQETIQEIQHLASKKNKSAIPKFKEYMKDESPLVRHAASKAIYDVGGKEELPALIETLKDPDRSVRAGMLRNLGA